MSIDFLLDSITLRDIIYFIVGIIATISIIVEKSKNLPFNPWTSFLKWVGRIVTHDISIKLESIEEQQKTNTKAIKDLDKKMIEKFAEKQKDDDEKEAKRLRSNIISFADSCRVGNLHTQNHFENVMRDYSDYLGYCVKHNIPNHFIDSEYKYIESVYQERLRENEFL